MVDVLTCLCLGLPCISHIFTSLTHSVCSSPFSPTSPLCSLRSKTSIRYFPKLFSAYFYLFHVYFFSFPYGFSYLAWLTAMLFLLHATMHLMNHYEIPAFQQV